MNNDIFKFRVAVKQGLEWQIYDVLNILYKLDGTIWVRVIRQTETATFTAWFQVDGENAILERSTGLTDKNGKPVFDGDVIQEDGINRYIHWHDGGWCYSIRHDSKCHWHLRKEDVENAEIIGNIHEMEEK